MVHAHNNSPGSCLIVSIGQARVALPLEHVDETMRPLPVAALAGAPSFVRGASIIRGEPTPVVDLAALLGMGGGETGRFVVIRAGGRPVALAVGGVLGIRNLKDVPLGALPGLLGDVRGDLVAALGAADEQLLVVLGAGRIVGDEVYESLAGAHERSI